jgi:hypothetical protein
LLTVVLNINKTDLGQFYWCLTPLWTIAQLPCGNQFYWCLTPLSTK